MPLAPGTRLGPYQVTAQIGAGGMGEVYKAHDTRLDRTVAIKVLPPEFSADPERRARFEREAKTIAGLSHPHICTLHDVGEHEGSTFLVMEHLTGETLAERLTKGALPLEQALTVATEIADALAAAHRQGVIHRDLKPGNVMLTKAGAKLLDFGLAKLKGHGEQPAAARLASVPTQSTPLTGEGVILGTLQYMAPEQLEGKPADARTDLWALGASLYEMLTGNRAFKGASAASLIGNIMNAEPAPLSSLQPLTPRALQHVAATCLAKEPDARWQAASDVARELQWIADECRLARGRTGDQPPSVGTADLSAPKRRHRAWLLGGAVTLAAVVAVTSAAVTWVLRGERRPDREVRRALLDIRPAEGLRHGGGASSRVSLNRPSRTALALTPDGRRLVFTAAVGNRQQLYVRDLGETAARPIPDTEGAVSPVVSPDSRWVAFFVQTRPGEGTLKRVALDGSGPPVDICKGAAPFGMSWGDDGAIVFATNENSGLWRVSSDGGTPVPLTTPRPGELGHRLPHVLPGARAVLFTVVEQPYNWETARVVVHRIGTKEWREIARGAADARYLPSGHLVYFRRGQLMAVPFDLEGLVPSGKEVGIVSNVMQSTNGINISIDLGAAQVTVSSTGTLAYVVGGEFPDPKRKMVWVDGRGQVEPLSTPARPFYVPRLSPDDQCIAVETRQSERRIWLHDLRVPGSLVPLTEPDAGATNALWTSDGKRLAFTAFEKGRQRLFWMPSDGTRAPERLGPEEGQLFPGSWTPDGQLLYLRYTPERLFRIHLLSREGSGWQDRRLLNSRADERYPFLSPDGRWLAYVTNETGRYEVYVRRFPTLADRRPVSSGGGVAPVWARDGKALFYIGGPSDEPERQELVVHQVGPDGAPASTGRTLFALFPQMLTVFYPLHGYDVTRDGRRFLFTQWPDTPPPPPPSQIEVVFNWFEELKAKVPRQ